MYCFSFSKKIQQELIVFMANNIPSKKTKIYEKISASIKEGITSGKLKIGEAIYSEPELCKKFKASRTSVRTAIRQLVAENLLVSKQGVGTFVKGNGHGLIYNCICLVNHHSRRLQYDIADTHYMDCIFGVEGEVTKNKIDFQVFSGVLNSVDDLLEVKQNKVDGLIIDGAFLDYNFNVDDFIRVTPHTVVLNADPKSTKLPCIVPDYENAFGEMISLLGKKQVANAIFLHNGITSLGQYKLKMFKKAIKNKGFILPELVDYSENMSPDNFLHDTNHYILIYNALQKYLTGSSRPSCIIASHDHAAAKALRVVKQHNMLVPEDIGIVGFYNMNIATMLEPYLTTVDINMGQAGVEAVKFLLDLIHDRTRDRLRMLPYHLMKRQSHRIAT
jgi:DNA-binding LacI/PurR family transcriptional regulator/DNA-binding transcriptional regulator YhcF (GntR family)